MNSDSQQYCDHCGAELTPGSRFCDGCGQPLLQLGDARAPVHPAARKAAHTRSVSFMRQRIAWALIFGLLLIPLVLFLIWKDVGEFSSDVWLSLGAFIAITTVLGVFTLRKGSGSWQGELFQVIQREKGVQFNFITDQGKDVIIFGGASLADYYSPGDRVVKIRGYDFPEKIERDDQRQLCVVCGKVYPIQAKRCRFFRFPSIDPHNFI